MMVETGPSIFNLRELTLTSVQKAAEELRPNVLFFFVDDMGYGGPSFAPIFCLHCQSLLDFVLPPDLGAWQNQRNSARKFETPVLDMMSAEGALMTQHYAA